ncbi:transcriptional regulator [Thermocladium modestius]|uniref:Transcriptional regulator n=1 Tax=Thermocladium modestius TaxID=62609 RepID=A0A830GYA8_9CREN|nr:substrate-binding domain-containing protein [Thermocladium modestius]GGP22173.1 transcriptional regulator [Thermocladium modestius]
MPAVSRRSRDELIIGNGLRVDARFAYLLKSVMELGSLNAAARRVGVPYASAWEWISKAESFLGRRLMERQRGGEGGGGARLTGDGVALLRELEAIMGGGADLAVSGSNDEAVPRLLGLLELSSSSEWVGSLNGLSKVLMMEVDVAGIHLMGGNEEAIDELGLSKELRLVKGYRRSIGLVIRSELTLKQVVEGLREGRLRLKMRNLGSGTRMLIDKFLADNGLDPAEVASPPSVARTHVEVAKAVARGEADVGVAIEYAASLLGLQFIRLAVEDFDFVYLRGNNRPAIRKFESLLESDVAKSMISRMKGYIV